MVVIKYLAVIIILVMMMVLAAAANIYSLSILYVLSNVIFIAVVLKVLLVGFVFFFIH